MKSRIIIGGTLAIISIALLYYGAMVTLTDKYIVGFTSGDKGIVRLTKTEWLISFFQPAAYVEQKLLGDPRGRAAIYLDSPEIRDYFKVQAKATQEKPKGK